MPPRISYAAGGSCCAIALITRDEPSEVPASIYVRMVGFVMLDWPQSAEVGRLPFVGYKLMCVCPINGDRLRSICTPASRRLSSHLKAAAGERRIDENVATLPTERTIGPVTGIGQ